MARWGTTETDDQPFQSQRIFAPWTDAQVEALNAWQQAGHIHPFTCGAAIHDDDAERPSLVAQSDGWACPDERCRWRQNWAHAFMADPNVLANREDELNEALGDFFDAQRLRERAAAARRAQGEEQQ